MSSHMENGFRLSYETAAARHTRVFDQSPILIGRSALCDVVLDSSEVSRKHLAIVRQGSDWFLQDLSSRTGTFLHGIRVTRQRLCDGDSIVLAAEGPRPVVLTFHLTSPLEKRSGLAATDLGETSILARIDLADFEQTLYFGPPAGQSASSATGTGQAEVQADLPPGAIDREALSRLVHARLPAIGLFKQVSELLLTGSSLETILEKVLHLAVDAMPGQRGVIYLYDEARDALERKASRVKPPLKDASFSVSQSVLNAAVRGREALLVSNAGADPRFRDAVSILEIGIRAAMCVPLYHSGRVKGLIYVDSQRTVDAFTSSDLEVLTVLGLMVAVGLTQMELRDEVDRERTIRARLSRYYSPQVVERIISRVSNAEGEMLADEHDVTVLFADLASFTPLAEGMPPGEVIQLLNTVFEQLGGAVFQYEGTLDKYIGDAIMAVFGAPLPQPDHACRAVRSALLMQQLIAQHNRRRSGESLQIRIGINSGKVIAGDIGSPMRKDYTVIGDAVNTASRLEAHVAQPGQIVVGPTTYELVREHFRCQPLPEVRLRGKQKSIQPYLVLGEE